MAYTEADVVFDEGVVRAALQTWGVTQEALLQASAAASRLGAAALEGTKVPALVADNAALLAGLMSSMEVPISIDLRRHMREKFKGEARPGAALLAEHQRDVSALQAQVATLTAVRDAYKEMHREAMAGWQNSRELAEGLAAERDDERAAVEAMAQAINKHLPGFHPAQTPDDGIHLLAEQRDEAHAERDALCAQVAELASEAREAWPRPPHPNAGEPLVVITRPLSFWLALSATPAAPRDD